MPKECAMSPVEQPPAGKTASARTSPLRVALLPERIGMTLSPCASIRLHAYFDALRQRGQLTYRVLFTEEMARFRPDVIAWHRIAVPDVDGLQQLTSVAKSVGAKLLYDLDDNLLDMDDHAEGDRYSYMREAVARSLKVADEVWCSTPTLTTRVREVAPGAVHTLANSIDPSVWRPARVLDAAPPGGPLRLLYMGTRTHQLDYAFLSGVMERLHRTHAGAFLLTVIGIRHHDHADMPWLKVRSAPNYVGGSYPAFVHWLQNQSGFDLGVAPLVDSAFNACKSHVKVLDYAALGLPSVASAVPAYAHALRDGLGCRLVPNDIDAWCQLLVDLHENRALLRTLADGAGALVGPAPFEVAVGERAKRLAALATPAPGRPVKAS
jgi:glycosyltransferase involved in cell wall biosynthesis